jgi:hypothetical protein
MTKKSDDEVLIDGLIDTLAVLEHQEAALRDLRVKLEPLVNGLYDRWRSEQGEP